MLEQAGDIFKKVTKENNGRKNNKEWCVKKNKKKTEKYFEGR